MGQSLEVHCCGSRDQGDEVPNAGCCGGLRVPTPRRVLREAAPQRVVLGHYTLNPGRGDLLGAGTSSECYRGFDLLTNKQVAIKVYKAEHLTPEHYADSLCKFRRQVEVLKELMTPFETPSDETLWCERLACTDPGNLFVQLLDYSRDESGEAGPDPADGNMYVVTELAQCSLKDYIRECRENRQKVSQRTVRNITKAILLVVAGLHAKNLVHIDLKPDNLMIFDGVLKLIDVDGCQRTGSTVTLVDGTISFSAIYCAPEWAKLLALQTEEIVITPALDVWSVGMTLCELVLQKPVLAETFGGFFTSERSYTDASCLFMDWLHKIESPPIPTKIQKFDSQLYHLLVDNILVLDPSKRKSMTESLRHSYVRSARLSPYDAGPLTCDADTPRDTCDVDSGIYFKFDAVEHNPHTVGAPVDGDVIHRGVLWTSRLGVEGYCSERSQDERWVRCDAWLAKNGSLWFRTEEEEEEGNGSVVLESAQVATAVASLFMGEAARPTIQLLVMRDLGGEGADQEKTPRKAGTLSITSLGTWTPRASPCASSSPDRISSIVLDKYLFGCESEEDRSAWLTAFYSAQQVTVNTMKLTTSMMMNFHAWRYEESH